jgi:tetratricopeptide (TPR) repeat protein
MPAGRRDESYSKLLQGIDWSVLYAEHNGYMMFEDLKEQWRESFDPDYVLIDSRTGHTDVGGICTRHLPDSVVLLFLPNEQNLRGLEGVVRDVRDEAKAPRNKRILLHFVMSNVPDLDDEDHILGRLRTEFQRQLGFKRVLMIHHYNSLALLNQTIFCEDRPRSRLAGEYRQLAREVIRRNPQDMEGALIFLSRYNQERRLGLSALEAEIMLEKIEAEHVDDGDIQTQLAFLRMNEGALDDAKKILERAVEKEVTSAHSLVQRAYCRLLLKEDRRGAEADALRAMKQKDIDEADAGRALHMLAESENRGAFLEVACLPNISQFPPAVRLSIGHRLNRATTELRTAIEVLNGVISDSAFDDHQREHAELYLVLSLIGIGAFSDALRLLEQKLAAGHLDTINAFNFAMTKWAESGERDEDLFRRVIDLDPRPPAFIKTANYAQCMAIAHWAVGNRDAADECLARAKSLADGWEFSCWRYLEVAKQTFIGDIEAARQMFSGENLRPEFFSRKQQLSLRQGLLDS